jgi:hypothetical protein
VQSLWSVSPSLTLLKLHDNPVWQLIRDSKYLAIKTMALLPRVSLSNSSGRDNIDSSADQEPVFEQMRHIRQARTQMNRIFIATERPGYFVSRDCQRQRRIQFGTAVETTIQRQRQNACEKLWEHGRPQESDYDLILRCQCEGIQLQSELHAMCSKKLFLKRERERERADQILTDARSHSRSCLSISTLSETVNNKQTQCHLLGHQRAQRINFLFPSDAAEQEQRRLSRGEDSLSQYLQDRENELDQDAIGNQEAKMESALTTSLEAWLSRGDNNNKKKEKKKKQSQLQEKCAITIQKHIRGYLLRQKMHRLQRNIAYEDAELDALFADGAGAISFDDELFAMPDDNDFQVTSSISSVRPQLPVKGFQENQYVASMTGKPGIDQ